MQVPDEIRKCVAFVAYEKENGERRTAGTAFFVGVNLNSERMATYLVTARHVIEDAKKDVDPRRVLIRVNMRDEASYVEVARDSWVFPDDRSDIAIANIALPEALDHRVLDLELIATKEVIAKHGIGPGDDVFLTGLFTKHRGEKKNIPVIRVGNIAAMPEEQVRTKMGYIDAYLVEARSIGGLSGSPVFVVLSGFRVTPSGQQRLTAREFFLLGVMHGHWDNPTSEIDDPIEDSFEDERINSGIAVVVPATKILDLLNTPFFESGRQKLKSFFEIQNAPTLDTAPQMTDATIDVLTNQYTFGPPAHQPEQLPNSGDEIC